MNIKTDHVFQVPRQQLWDLLLDAKRLANCIPGCEKMQEDGPDQYTAILKVGVASVKGTYTGRVELRDKQPPSHYKLAVEGKAAPGYVRGLAAMDLAEQGPRETRLTVNGDVEVGGLIASVGQRFLSGIAVQMAKLFFKNIEKELETGGGGA